MARFDTFIKFPIISSLTRRYSNKFPPASQSASLGALQVFHFDVPSFLLAQACAKEKFCIHQLAVHGVAE
jgi:hypothetical protein